MHTRRTSLSGWGRHPVVTSTVTRPEKRRALRQVVTGRGNGALEAGPDGSVLARGAGRSYGDAALTRDGLTVAMGRLDRMLAFDAETGWLRAEAGVRLREILAAFVPRGWFLPVTPGTKEITLGGAIAFDVHGKNHHCDGGISNFVRAFELLTADGSTRRCTRETNADLFWATVSGAGLTGIITEVELQLQPIETAHVATRRIKARDLEDAFAVFEAYEPEHQYAVAWIDCLASGADLGRSLCMFGDHAPRDALDAGSRTQPLDYTPDRWFDLPVDLPSGLLNRWTVRAFNRLYYGRQRQPEVQDLEPIDPFFYPLDAIGDWNRMYGADGFVQYQCVLPMDASYDGLVDLLQAINRSGHASFLAVLKRMGPADAGLLSFPMRGYTLALDMPYQEGLEDFLHELDEIVLRHGGRVYLAKDVALQPEAFRTMYPQYEQWRSVKQAVDPDNRFASDLSRRLGITP
jgi:FAD/FMN-containing dehydrogenase